MVKWFVAAWVLATLLLGSLLITVAHTSKPVVRVEGLYALSMPLSKPSSKPLAVYESTLYSEARKLYAPTPSAKPIASSTLLTLAKKLWRSPRVGTVFATSLQSYLARLWGFKAVSSTTSSTLYTYVKPLKAFNPLSLEVTISPSDMVVNNSVFAGFEWYNVSVEAKDLLAGAKGIEVMSVSFAVNNATVSTVVCRRSSCSYSGSLTLRAYTHAIELGREALIEVSFPWSLGGNLSVCASAVDSLGVKAVKCLSLRLVNETSLSLEVKGREFEPGQKALVVVRARYRGTNVPVANDSIVLEVLNEKGLTVLKKRLGATNSRGVLEAYVEVPKEPGVYYLRAVDEHGGSASARIEVKAPYARISSIQVSGPGFRNGVVVPGSTIYLRISIEYSDRSVLRYARIVIRSSPLLDVTYFFTNGTVVKRVEVVKLLSIAFSPTSSSTGVLTLKLFVPKSVSGTHDVIAYLGTSVGTSSAVRKLTFGSPLALSTSSTVSRAPAGGARVMGGLASTMIIAIAALVALIGASATLIALYVIEKRRRGSS